MTERKALHFVLKIKMKFELHKTQRHVSLYIVYVCTSKTNILGSYNIVVIMKLVSNAVSLVCHKEYKFLILYILSVLFWSLISSLIK